MTIMKKTNLKPQSFFNKVADTVSTELFPWTMISAAISYKILQIYWSKPENCMAFVKS